MSPLRRLSFIAASIFTLIPFGLRAQIANVTASTSTPTPGVGHDYVKLLSETVDPATGSLSLRLGVPAPTSRGLALPFAFSYDSNSLTLQQAGPGLVAWSYSKGLFNWGPWSNTLPQLTANLQQYLIPNTSNACYSSLGYLFQDPSGSRHALRMSAILSNPSVDTACPQTFWSNTYFSGGDDFVSAVINGIGTQGDALYTTYGAGVGAVQVADAHGTVYTFANPQTGNWNCFPGQAVSGPQLFRPMVQNTILRLIQ
jgi:hypothetical protein